MEQSPTYSLFAQDEASLSESEQNQLARLEETIERGLKTFVDVGTALIVVRDSRLYRQDYGTFEDYCQQRWGMQRKYAYKLIAAAEVVQNLSPIGDILPATESQARPLTPLAPNEQREVWAKAVATAQGGKVTAAHVQRVADEYEKQAQELSGDEDAYTWAEDALDVDVSPVDSPATLIVVPAAPTPDISAEYDSDEWYTPIEFIEAARAVMGSIDLDPASSGEAQKIIGASTYYTLEDDGLEQEWLGRNVWLNPPYSAPRPWVEKLIESLEMGSVESAILLVNTANSPQWARPLWHGSYVVCLLDRRVRFWRPDRPDAKGFDRDQMIWYLGHDVNKFRAVFGAYGAIR